jgi:NRAMP (natural resistance-associated macrophage protein)-like metal ion transporter
MKKLFNLPLYHLMFFLSIIGPGLISAIAGNDAGGITTFSVAGARFGYTLFWTMIPLILLLVIVQEMCARMGVVTGKGLADLIRENFGLKMTVTFMVGLFFANFATTASEFAGIAAASELFGLNRYLSVLFAAFIVLFLIIKINYKILEKVFLFMCLFYVTYIISGVLAHPDWRAVGHAIITPTFLFDVSYLVILVGLLGTSITPWMQFYLQSSIVEKGLKISEYRYARWELILAAILATSISFFILLAAAATLFPQGITIENAAEAATALEPIAGHFAEVLFALGLFAAALFGAFILPLSTAYYVCEAFGWESGVNKKFHEAREFYIVIGLLVVPSVIVVLIPAIPLVPLMLLAQVINGLLLPILLLVILHLINKEKVMGEYVNKPLYNVICWIAAVLLIFVTLIMVGMTLLQIG